MKEQPKVFVAGLSGQSLFFTVDHFPLAGETLPSGPVFAQPGGKGYNQAVAASRLGARVTYLTAVGRDLHGEQCRQRLEQEHMEELHFIEKSGSPTALAVILTDREGENRVIVHRGAADELSAADVTLLENELARCDLALVQLELPLPVVREILRLAGLHKVRAVLNPAPMTGVEPVLLRGFYLITPNESEVKAILGLPQEEPHSPEFLADRLIHHGFRRAVVTLGARGALVLEASRAWLVHASPARFVADTTGAGDVFSGALCARLAAGDELFAAASYAGAAASLSVEHPHVLDGIPNCDQMLAEARVCRCEELVLGRRS